MRHSPQKILRVLKKHRGNCAAAAKELGIHRSTVLRWKKRSYQNGKYRINGLRRLSTRPRKTIRHVLTLAEQQAIREVRNKRGVTAIKIKYELGLKASVNTIHRFLKRSGYVKKYGYHRRPRFQNTVHMHAKNVTTLGYLQMDVKVVTPELSGLPWTCFKYAVIDIYSRWKDAVILNQLDQNGAMATVLEIFPRLPFKPVFVQTDNGLEFQTRFHDMVVSMGLRHHFIHKSTPNENAVIERSFRTDEEEFYFRLPKRPSHYDDLRDHYQEYLRYYNHERIHLGIGLKTPAQMVANVLGD